MLAVDVADQKPSFEFSVEQLTIKNSVTINLLVINN